MSHSTLKPPRGGASPHIGGSGFDHHHQTTTASASSTQIRSLVFSGSITLAITVANSPASTFYIQAPRIAYLPLLVPQIRTLYLPLVSDEVAVEDQMWFDYNGLPLKWHWPIGLLYDYHTAHQTLLASAPVAPPSIASYFTSALTPSPSIPPGDPSSQFQVTLHLKDPPTDALLLGSSIDTCRTGFMNMVKEADYVRWGSVKRVTNLRKEQQDGLWDGVVQNDFDKYWIVASKLIPLPSATSAPSTRASTPFGSSNPNDGRMPEANAMRSVPLRLYLPEGAPVLQDVVPPVQDDQPTTLLHFLRSLVPLFFPENRPPLAKALLHGIVLPLETEIGWLGACMPGADGWLSVVLVLEGK